MSDYEGRAPSRSELAEEQAWIEYDRTREQREQTYLWWCAEHLLDPQDTQSMVEYEMTFDDSFRV